MKILIINKFLHPNGGAETYILKLGKELKRHGHEVEYFGMEHEGRCVGNNVDAYTKDMDFHNGSLFSKAMYSFMVIYSSMTRKKIRKVLADFKPDVCHLNNFNYQLTPSVILEIVKWQKQTGHKCKIVYTAHDYQLICPNHMLNNPNTHKNCEKCLGGHFFYCTKGRCIHGSYLKSLAGTIEAFFWKCKGVYEYIDTIICPSGFMKQKLDSNPLFRDRTVMIHNFIDIKADNKEGGDAVSFIKEMTGCTPEKYVLYFGRYSEEKGINKLVSVCKELPDIPFIFAGKGELSTVLEDVSNICDIGFQTKDKLDMLISNARFVVMPSEWYEPFGLSVAESISLGTPVIGTALGGIKEIIDESGAGVLYNSDSKDELKKAIISLWEDDELLEKLKIKCRDYKFMDIERYYEWLIDKIY